MYMWMHRYDEATLSTQETAKQATTYFLFNSKTKIISLSTFIIHS